MKKILTIFISLMIILSLFNMPAFADEYYYESFDNFSGKIEVEFNECYDYVNVILNRINKSREKNGLNKLILDKDLTESSLQLSIETIVTDSYTRPNGEKWHTLTNPIDKRNATYFTVTTLYNSSDEMVLGECLRNIDYIIKNYGSNLINKQYNSVGISVAEYGIPSAPTYDSGGEGYCYMVYIILGERKGNSCFYEGKQSITKEIEFKNYDIYITNYLKDNVLFLNTNNSKFKSQLISKLNDKLSIPYDNLKLLSENESIVKISNEGKITAVGEGITNINVSYNDGGISFSKKFEIQVIDALKCRHFFDYNNPVIKKKATCEDFGIYQYTCNICTLSIEEMVPKTGCLYAWKTIKEPTMFSKGLMEYRCEYCSDLLKSHATSKFFLTNKNISIFVKNKSIKVKYKKVKEANGFQIRYKTKGKWKYINVNKNKSITKTIKKLKKGKYSVQVRLFKNNNSNRTYTNWCKRKVRVK